MLDKDARIAELELLFAKKDVALREAQTLLAGFYGSQAANVRTIEGQHAELEYLRSIVRQAQADGAMIDPSALALAPAAQGENDPPLSGGHDSCWDVMALDLASAPSAGETVVRDALIQAKGALLLDTMVDAVGKPYGTTTVALEAIDEALAAITSPLPDDPDDETCTCCYGTGYNAVMERTCDCQPAPASTSGDPSNPFAPQEQNVEWPAPPSPGLEWRCPKCGAQADERYDCCQVTDASASPSPAPAPSAGETVLRAAMLMNLAAQTIRDHAADAYPIYYDDAQCDGSCLADDLEASANALAAAPTTGEPVQDRLSGFANATASLSQEKTHD